MPPKLKSIFKVFFCFISLFSIFNHYAFGQNNSLKKINSFSITQSNQPNSSHFENNKSAFPTQLSPLRVRGSKRSDNQVSNSHKESTTTCLDTSVRLLYSKSPSYIGSGWLSQTADGNFINPGGYSSLNSPFESGGYLVKFTPQGDTVWTKKLVGGYSGRGFSLYRSLELANHDLLVIGKMSIPMPYNGKSELFVSRLTSNGELLWAKTYNNNRYYPDSTIGDFDINNVKESQDGDLYISGGYPFAGPSRGAILLKLSSKGSLLWSKEIEAGSFPLGIGVDIQGNEVRFFAKTGLGNYIFNSTNAIFITRMNATNGDTLSVKAWSPPYSSLSFFQTLGGLPGIVKLSNGNIAVYGQARGDYQYVNNPSSYYHQVIEQFDSNLNGLSGYVFSSQTPSNNDNTRITVHPDGSASFSRLHYISSYSANVIIGKFEHGQIVKERVISYRGISTQWISNFVQLPGNGTLVCQQNFDSSSKIGGYELIRLHNSDTSSSCLGIDTTITQVEVLPQLVMVPFYIDKVYTNLVVETNRNFTGIVNEPLIITNNCKQTSFCNSLKISTPKSLVCLTEPVTINIQKNIECGSKATWHYDTSAIQSLVYLNDSTLEARFKNTFDGYISASIQNCTLIKDSLHIVVLKTPNRLDLGPDTTICPNNTLLLTAHSGYASYLWQDGSTDSTYIVHAPGKYFVRVYDACGNTFTDTVEVNAAPPIPFDIGPDVTKCNKDTLNFVAPSGYISYSWSPDYNISSTASQKILVFPVSDTTYSVKAEKTPGCFAYDSIKVTVHHSPAIKLGRDQSFCQGDSLLLDTNHQFDKYLWSTGDTTHSIIVKAKGIYSVMGITEEGCKSYDTLQVIQVNPNPIVQLNKDTALCTGNSRTLDAGSGHTAYSWNDGSTAQTLSITTAGTYWVSVIDFNGCTGSDSTRIIRLNAPPSNFLPNDTSICNYGTLLIHPLSSYSSYQWSTGATDQNINAMQPGIYWLQVKDRNNCIGRDTLLVALKSCMEGFYIPNAFTPNRDSKNDVFRPLLFGDIVNYTFTIYNRWGQPIFTTNEVGKGWDGKIKSLEVDGNVYVWKCVYQLAGQSTKMEKGTVLLIK